MVIDLFVVQGIPLVCNLSADTTIFHTRTCGKPVPNFDLTTESTGMHNLCKNPNIDLDLNSYSDDFGLHVSSISKRAAFNNQ